MKRLLSYVIMVALIISVSPVFAKGQMYNFKANTAASQVSQAKQISEKHKHSECHECCNE